MKARDKSTIVFLGIGTLVMLWGWLFYPQSRPHIPPDQIIPAAFIFAGLYLVAFFIVRGFNSGGERRGASDNLEAILKALRSDDKVERYIARGFVMLTALMFIVLPIIPPNVFINIMIVLMSIMVVSLVVSAIIAAFYVALKARPTE